eukprot:SAG11_NODE_3294_length_2546_cov_1.591745_2_plen_189_part_00
MPRSRAHITVGDGGGDTLWLNCDEGLHLLGAAYLNAEAQTADADGAAAAQDLRGLLRERGAAVRLTSQLRAEASQRVGLQFGGRSLPRVLTLLLHFRGNISDQMRGLYRTRAVVEDNAEAGRWLAVTQFEPADARRCFPCWDERAPPPPRSRLGSPRDSRRAAEGPCTGGRVESASKIAAVLRWSVRL